MKKALLFVAKAVLGGLLVVVPIYLAVLVLLKGMKIEEFEDGRYTVFVPSIPTPFAGAVYILDRKRVHPLDVPFHEALKVVSRWGSGAKDLVAAMERDGNSTR